MARSRRWILQRGLTGTAALAAGLWPAALLAQNARGPFGISLPGELQRLIPPDVLDFASIAESLIALEREADLRQLPHSALELLGSGSLPANLDELYSAALPRLVALIDRASGARADGGMGERAGGLLARLHGGEHQVPEALLPHVAANAVPAGPRLVADCRIIQAVEEPSIVFLPGEVAQDLPEAVEEAVTQADDAPPAEPLAELSPPRNSTRYSELAEEYRAFFGSLTVRAERRDTAEWCCTMLRQSRSRYERVGARTGVPWFFVGATHALEASFNFRGHLHNGDHPLSQRTRQVPANRPQVWLPPSDWESSAIDALRAMGFAGQSDWSLERTLYRLEAYNGFGYRRRGVPTPYLWSFSGHYDRGKFVADGRWNASARSQQCGAAVMLKLLLETGDIAFG